MTKQLRGTGVALITPFTAEKRVDTKALTRIVEYVTDGGVDFIVVLGTTSEAPTLSKEEKALVRETIIKANKKHLPLVLGIGGNNTQSVIEEIKSTDLTSFDAILSVTPYYNKPSQNGLYAHFAAIAKESSLPIILYNVPGRTGVCMTAETILRLANDFKNIIAVKEASGNLVLDMNILKDMPKHFTFLSGDDTTTLPSVYMGGSGAISVIGIAFPKEFSEMVRLGLNGNTSKANALQYELLPMMALAFKEGNPTGIKAILDLLNKENEKGFNVDNIYGIKRPVSFDKEIIERIVNSSDEIKEFSKFCENIQYIDAYSAKQFFVDDKEHNKKWAYYVLIENLRTVLPYKPNVEIFSMNYIKNEEVAFWKIFFCAYKVDENGEEGFDKIGESIYDDFIKRLPSNKYKFIDASYIVVEPLNKDEILEILK